MSFTTLQYEKQPSPDLIPVVVFPGIFGTANDFKHLAAKLHHLFGEAIRLHLYFDNRLGNFDLIDEGENTDLNTQAESFVNYILGKAKTEEKDQGFSRIVIAGYSHGCTHAVLMAQLLKRENIEADVVLIDDVSPAVKSQFLKSNDLLATKLLIDILQHAANIAGIKEKPKFTKETLSKLKELTLEPRVDEIIKIILDHNTETFKKEEKEDDFLSLATMFKNELGNICEHKNVLSSVKLNKIMTLIREETDEMYHHKHGGWIEYANEIEEIIDDRFPNDMTHLEFTSQRSQAILADILAKIIDARLNLHLKGTASESRETASDINFILMQTIERLKKLCVDEKTISHLFRETADKISPPAEGVTYSDTIKDKEKEKGDDSDEDFENRFIKTNESKETKLGTSPYTFIGSNDFAKNSKKQMRSSCPDLPLTNRSSLEVVDHKVSVKR